MTDVLLLHFSAVIKHTHSVEVYRHAAAAAAAAATAAAAAADVI